MTSKLIQMQARFQQKQMEQKEEKLLKLYESQQQRAFERVGRGSAGSNASVGSTGGGKVRQMFDERRQKAGIDRSYPLQPLKNSKTSSPTTNSSIDRNKNNKVIANRTPLKTTTSQRTPNVTKNNNNRLNNKARNVPVNINNNSDNKIDKPFDEVDGSHSHRDLIEMMNNHNLKNNLEDEEIPSEIHDGYLTDGPESEEVLSNHHDLHKTPTVNRTVVQESKPIVRRSVIKTVSSPTGKAISRQSKTSSSPLPSKPASHDTIPKMKKPPSERSPSSSRPSVKQGPRTPVVREDLAECKYCGRHFASDRLAIHEDICAKMGKKKRKTYDATKHRVQGTELEPYVKKSSKSNKSTRGSMKKDWRKTHEEFIAAIRAAKMAQQHIAKGGKLSDLPPPPPSSNPDYIQCPHCGRRFNEAAAERHIPKCANYQFNKPKPGAAPGRKPVSGRK